MPNNKKHHYVPRFYLKRFSENRRSICLYNLPHERKVTNANLKNQCYKDYFYGKDGNTEDALCVIENDASFLFKDIDKYGCLPPPMTEPHVLMVLYILIQHGRTEYQADAMDEMHDKMFKQVFREKLEAELEGVNIDDFIIGIENVSQYSLQLLAQYYPLLLDLGYKLLKNKTSVEFVTSDNPVVLYNQLMSYRRMGSNTGLLSKGLQVFFPISPSEIIVLYDTDVYRLGNNSKISIDITNNKDVYSLNMLQACSCYENIYFKSDGMNSILLHKKAKPYLRKAKSHIKVVPEYDNGEKRSELIMNYQEDIDSNFHLSCLTLRKSAKKWRSVLKKERYQPAAISRESLYTEDVSEFKKRREGDKDYKGDFLSFLNEKYGNS